MFCSAQKKLLTLVVMETCFYIKNKQENKKDFFLKWYVPFINQKLPNDYVKFKLFNSLEINGLKQNTILTFCKIYTRPQRPELGKSAIYCRLKKKQLVNFGCKEMQTSGRKFVKSYRLAEAVTARILQWRTFLIFVAFVKPRS